MAEATHGLSARLSRGAGGAISFTLRCEKSVVTTLCITGVILYGLYTTSNLLARAIDGIVNKGLEGYRIDQGRLYAYILVRHYVYLIFMIF